MSIRSRFHHAGYVVPSIRDNVEEFQKALFLDWDGIIVNDPLQMVNVTFLPANVAGAGTIELVEPAGLRSPVNKFLGQGGGLHHVCYEVVDLAARLRESQEAGCTLVRVPLPARAFGGRKIAWVVTPGKFLIEYLDWPADLRPGE